MRVYFTLLIICSISLISFGQSAEEFFYSQGNIKYKHGDYQGAIQEYNKAIWINPEYAMAYNKRGLAKGKLEDFNGAIQDHNKALEISPDYQDAWINREFAMWLLERKKAGNLDWSWAYYIRGNTKIMRISDKRGAIRDYTKAIDINPNFAEAYNSRGLAKYYLDDYRGAIQDFTKAIEIDPKYARAYLNRGNAKIKLNDEKGANLDWSWAAELSDKNAYEFFNIGNKKIFIPSPEGFTHVTQEIKSVYQMRWLIEDPMHDILSFYILESDIPILESEDLPFLERIFIIKINKKIKNIFVSSNEFKKLKNLTINQNKKIYDKIKSQYPNIMDEKNERLKNEFDKNIAFKISNVIPLEPHYMEENAISYSMFIKYGVTDEGINEDLFLSGTITFLNISGKVLFLYCYGNLSDLEWTRSASKSWTEKIINSNNLFSLSSTNDRDMDLDKVINEFAIETVTGSLIALILSIIGILIFTKRKRRKENLIE